MSLDSLNTTLNRAIHASADLLRFVDIAQAGLHVATEAGHSVELRREVAEVLGKPNPFPTETAYEDAKGQAQELEAFARRERERGFDFLYGLATVRLWTILEILVDDLAVLILQEPDLLTDQQVLQELEGPVLPFVRATPAERAEYLADRLRAHVKGPLKSGIGRFEALLGPVRLGGPVDATVRRILLELSEVRHALVHRDGLIDKKLRAACPWLADATSERLQLTRNHYMTYAFGVDWYILEIALRAGKVFGTEVPERTREVQNRVHDRLTDLLVSRPPSSGAIA